jgi:hypothetical protein
MKAARVPVIISDEWVEPTGIPWKEFCVFVAEDDVHNIPNILESIEPSYEERARISSEVWKLFFSRESLSKTITKWGLDILEGCKTNGNRGRVPLKYYYHEFFKPGFWRSGVIPEVIHWGKSLTQYNRQQ